MPMLLSPIFTEVEVVMNLEVKKVEVNLQRKFTSTFLLRTGGSQDKEKSLGFFTAPAYKTSARQSQLS